MGCGAATALQHKTEGFTRRGCRPHPDASPFSPNLSQLRALSGAALSSSLASEKAEAAPERGGHDLEKTCCGNKATRPTPQLSPAPGWYCLVLLIPTLRASLQKSVFQGKFQGVKHLLRQNNWCFAVYISYQ